MQRRNVRNCRNLYLNPQVLRVYFERAQDPSRLIHHAETASDSEKHTFCQLGSNQINECKNERMCRLINKQ
jgi:hypothetical protein